MNLSPQPRMERPSPCTCSSRLPSRGLLPVETPTWNTLGSPHPTLPAQPRGSEIWLPGTTERHSIAAYLRAAVEPYSPAFKLDPVLMNRAGWEARTQDTPGLAQSRLRLAGPTSLLTLTGTTLVGEREAEGCSAHWLRR